MKTPRFARPFAPVALALLLAAPAFAQEQPTELDKALAAMKSSAGDDYTAARTKLIALGDGARTALESRLAAATWTDATWNDLAVATIAHAYLAHPEVAQKVQKLEGLDPAHYLMKRRPAPECGRELRQLGPDAVGPILELYLKTFERYPFSTPATLPAQARNAKADDLAREERIALREGIVLALAESKHPCAFFVCRAVARDGTETAAARLQAAEGLGTLGTGTSLAEFVSLQQDVATPADVKLAAVRGAARVPSADALAFLSARLADADADVRRQAVVALGAFGSRHGWEARGAEGQKLGDSLRPKAATKLVDAIRAAEASAPADEIVDALATIAHPDSIAGLEALTQDESVSATNRALAKRALDRVKTAVARSSK